MDREEKERSRYFQTIARCFIGLRGAPFFLSAKDLDLISFWEKTGIPLSTVLEGIENAFEGLKQRRPEREKVLALSFCRMHVLKAFERFRERKVGGKRKSGTKSREDKQNKARNEIRRFLEHFPEEVGYLKGFFQEAQAALARSPVQESGLEQLDEKVENLLVSRCPDVERARVRREVKAGLDSSGEEELERIVYIKLAKYLRSKHRIPYLSLFYY
jgi:hypothetical protein